MGKGSSGVKAIAKGAPLSEWSQAFALSPAQMQEFSKLRTANDQYAFLEKAWADAGITKGSKVTSEELQAIQRGYVDTDNCYGINRELYSKSNAKKSIEKIFDAKTEKGAKDLATVRALDSAVKKGVSTKDGVYTRYTHMDNIRNAYGLTDRVVEKLLNFKKLTDKQRKTLEDAMIGTKTLSRSFTSTSANSGINYFRDMPVVRKLYAPKGTNMYKTDNYRESEVIFGRNLRTTLVGISLNSSGQIVFHERVDGYD